MSRLDGGDDDSIFVPADRTPAGYRFHGSSAIDRVALVPAAQAVGLSLAEIAKLCEALEHPSSEGARRLIGETRERVDANVASLQQPRRRLTSSAPT